jgi:hypothetical protein
MGRWVVLVLVGVSAALAEEPARGPTYRDEDLRVTVQFPPDWREMTPFETSLTRFALKLFISERDERNESGTAALKAGFQSKDGNARIYLFLEPRPPTRSFEEFEREAIPSLTKAFEAADAKLNKGVFGIKSSFEGVTPQSDRNRFLIRGQSAGLLTGKLDQRAVVVLGKKGVVFLQGEVVQAESAKYLPAVEEIFDSVTFDAGYEYVSPGSLFGSVFCWGPLAVVGSALLLALFSLARKKRNTGNLLKGADHQP